VLRFRLDVLLDGWEMTIWCVIDNLSVARKVRTGQTWVWRRRRTGLCLIEPPAPAFNLVKVQRPIDPLPKIAISYRHQAAKPLPMPSVLPPFLQSPRQSLLHVAATGDERHPGRLFDRLQAPNDGQQIGAVGIDERLDIGGRKRLRRIDALEHEPPL
jgi:hypothetical protein